MVSLLDKIKAVENGQEIDEEPGEEPGEEPAFGWDDLPPDPAPVNRRSSGPVVPKTYGKVTPAMKKRIAAELEVYIELLAMPVMMRDQHCGGAIHDNAGKVADAISQILARYPDVAHKFVTTGVFADGLKLALALKPIGEAIWEHHVVKTEGGNDSERLDLDSFQRYRPGQ